MADETDWKHSAAGPFELGRRFEEVGPDLGHLHEAWHVETGWPALRYFPSTRVDWHLSGRFEVLLVCESSPPSITLMLGPAPVTASSREVADVLVLGSAAYSRVEDTAEAHAHLVSGTGAPRARPPRIRWDWRVGAAGAVAGFVLCLGFWLLSGRRDTPAHDASSVPVPEASFLVEVNDLGLASPAYPLPDKPFRNQGTPPCKAKKAAVEINGGCWVELAQKPPCDDEIAEYQGKCYLPTTKPRPVPQSVEP